MSYYFEHVDEAGNVHDYYPGDPEFEIRDRGPDLPVAGSVLSSFDSSSLSSDVMNYYGEAPGTLTVDPPSGWSDFLLALVQQSQDLPENAELVGIETFALSPVDGSSTSGLKKILLDVIGPYDTVVTQYKYQQGNNSYYTYVNDISPDYPWLCSAALFIVLLVSVFSLVKRTFTWMK